MNMSSFFEIKYMKGLLFKARYMIRVGFKILARTPISKLPPPPHPHLSPHPPKPLEIEPLVFESVLV